MARTSNGSRSEIKIMASSVSSSSEPLEAGQDKPGFHQHECDSDDEDSDDGQVDDINEEDVIAAVKGREEESLKSEEIKTDKHVNEQGGSEGSPKPTPTSSSSETLIPSLAMSKDSLKAKLDQGSLEFEFIKPICAEVLRDPTNEKTLKIFEEALLTLGNIPVHLCEFVIFPFAIHLKLIKKFKEPERIRIFKALSSLLDKCELSNSYDMFVNIFQKLFVVLALPGNMTVLDTQLSEEEMKMITKCTANICKRSLPFHLDSICQPHKVQVFGHSIFILLQLLGPDIPKDIRLRALGTLSQIVELCDGKENRSKTLYQFLPGLISRTRKICIPSAGQTIKDVAQASLSLMGSTIKVSTEFINPEGLTQADDMLSQIMELLSKDYVLNTDVQYRKSFCEFCRDVSVRNTQLPKCSKAISSILLKMKEDSDSEVVKSCVEVLEKLGIVQELNFEDLTNLITAAETHLSSGDDTACVLALREAASVLSTRKLSFVEFQIFLPLLFQLVEAVVWKFRNSITVDKSKRNDPIFVSSTKLCQNVLTCIDLDEIIYEFTAVVSELQNNLNSVKNQTGVLVTFNIILTILIKDFPEKLNQFEAANLVQAYLSLLDIQSTELALTSISSDAPVVQSAAEIRKAYLLEGLGILGKGYPHTVHPIVLYPLIEHAGLENSEAVNEAADLALKRISYPSDLNKFLQENIDFIMSEIGVRMLSLSLYPNCPSALVFLAQYYDFSQSRFSSFIESTFERCSDTFGGGDVQHIYVQVFYALIKSISTHFNNAEAFSSKENEAIQQKKEINQTLLEKLLNYQKSVGISHPSIIEHAEDNVDDDDAAVVENHDTEAEDPAEKMSSTANSKLTDNNYGNSSNNTKIDKESEEQKLDPVSELVLRISHRVLNFLPNNERGVRLSSMECLILGLPLLKNHENSLLPLSHTIWQNLTPRFDEKDYVIVRKSFELLQTLCACSGEFLRKRTIDEAFPKLSTLLLNLAKEGELVKNKNRQYYTYTQAYKLQLTVLQGMGFVVDSIDVQEFELDKIVSGCIMYLNPDQHKNLREAATNLLKMIANGKRCRTVWMKLIACGIRKPPESLPHPSFTPLPKLLAGEGNLAE